MTFDSAEFLSNVPLYLKNAQIDMEKACKSFGEACDLLAEKTSEYRKKKLDGLEEAKSEGYPPSARSEIAKLKAWKEEGEMLKAQGMRDHSKELIGKAKERIFNIRYLGKSIESGLAN